MAQVKYGGAEGISLDLETSNEYLAVRSRSGRSFRAGVVPRGESSLLEDMELSFAFPDADVEIYRRKRSAPKSVTVDNVKNKLRQFEDTRFAGRVLVEKTSREPMIYTENLFIKFGDEFEEDHCLEILSEIGLSVKRRVDYARNAYFVGAPEGTGQRVFDMALTLLDRDDVECCHPEIVRRKGLRQIADPQWHLKSTTVNGRPINASANVEAAHELAQGDGITIAIIDDGVDIDHAEFSRSAKIISPRDVGRDSDNPRPRFSNDDHGTACAGVACADGRFGASGVAPKARLMPIRNVTALGSQDEADAIVWAADHGADIISCSWGPRDGDWWDPNDPLHNVFAPLPDSTRLAIDYAINSGRDGKGCVIFWAAGNGNESVDNDGYASYEKVFAVAACNDRGRRSFYSDFGDAIFCAFPSNDVEFAPQNPAPLTPGIWTTDRSGSAGYNDGDTRAGDATGDFTNSFGGTSSAAPGAAGVAALVLTRNADLRWDQVGDIMRRACDEIDSQNGQYSNGRSPMYGFGRLNAEAAVRLATPQTPVDTVVVTGNFNAPIRDFQTSDIQLSVGDDRPLAGIKVEVDIRHTYIGDLTVKLIPPAGTGVSAITLHNRTGGGTNNIRRTYDKDLTPKLSSLIGKKAAGTWKLEVRDSAFRDQGRIRQFGLLLDYSTSRATREARAKSPAKAVATTKSKSRKKKKTRRRAAARA